MFGVRKFHNYIYGRRFTLLTDHKPLTYILSPKQGIPPLAAARMQHWALILTGYNYDIQYRSTHAHANADGLSRLPIPDGRQEGNLADVTAFVIGQLEALPMQATEVEEASRADPTLAKVLEYLRQGWPKRIPDGRKDELSIEGDCIMWGIRVVIPKSLQSRVMSELHSAHPGIVRMEELARSHVWWPGLNKDIEMCVRACESCQGTRNVPTKAPLHPWAWPTNPWERVHIDFAGPVQGKIVTDAHSKWPEVQIMSSTTLYQLYEKCSPVSDFLSKWFQITAHSSHRNNSLTSWRSMVLNTSRHRPTTLPAMVQRNALSRQSNRDCGRLSEKECCWTKHYRPFCSVTAPRHSLPQEFPPVC